MRRFSPLFAAHCKLPTACWLFACLLLAASLLLVAGAAEALTLTNTGAVVTVSWTEPTQNIDNTPLDDLASTKCEWRFSDEPVWHPEPNQPATAPTGGGAIQTQVSIPVGPGLDKNVVFRAFSADLAGNVSDPSPEVSIRIDRKPPKSPN